MCNVDFENDCPICGKKCTWQEKAFYCLNCGIAWTKQFPVPCFLKKEDI